jgi:hypothetical protein
MSAVSASANPAPHRRPVDHRDQGTGQLGQIVDHAQPALQALLPIGRAGIGVRAQFLQITAGAKGPRTAHEHQNPYSRILADLLQNQHQLPPQLGVERISLFGPAEADPADVVFDREFKRFHRPS